MTDVVIMSEFFIQGVCLFPGVVIGVRTKARVEAGGRAAV